MTMAFRHLDYPSGADVTRLGPAALDALLERGDLETWRPLAKAVRADPHGPLAATVLRLCRAHPMYGTSKLWRSWIERLREEGPADGLSLAELRNRRGLTQQALSERMGVSQSDVSKLERRGDIRLSTLRAYVAATGGTAEIRAAYDDPEGQRRFRLR